MGPGGPADAGGVLSPLRIRRHTGHHPGGRAYFRTTGRVVLQNGWRDVQPLEAMPRKRKSKDESGGQGASAPAGGRYPHRDQGRGEGGHDQAPRPAHRRQPAPGHGKRGQGAGGRSPAGADEGQRHRHPRHPGRPSSSGWCRWAMCSARGKRSWPPPRASRSSASCPRRSPPRKPPGRWEKALDEITTGKQDPARFMEGIRKLSAFLVRYARENQQPAHFPEDARRRKFRAQQAQRRVSQAQAVDGVRLPPVRAGQGAGGRAGASSAPGWQEGCAFHPVEGYALTRGGGPELSARVVALLLAHRAVRGSTGTVALTANGMRRVYSARARSTPACSGPCAGKRGGNA